MYKENQNAKHISARFTITQNRFSNLVIINIETELSNQMIVNDILLTLALLWTLGFLKTTGTY